MARKIASFFCLIILIFQAFSCIALAENMYPSVALIASEEDNIVNVKLLLQGINFKGLKCNISYNNKAVIPVDFETDELTYDFKQFSKAYASYECSSILDHDDGLVLINNKIEEPVNTDDEIEIYEFKFKRLSDENANFKFINLGVDRQMVELVGDEYISSTLIVAVMVTEGLGEIITNYQFPKNDIELTADQIKDKKTKLTTERAKKIIFLGINNYATVSNDSLKWIDRDNKSVTPYIKENSIFVPLRFIAEQLGAMVDYNDQTSEIVIKTPTNNIKLKSGEMKYTINDDEYLFTLPPELSNERTFVQMEFIDKAFNRSTEYIENDKMVIITKPYLPWLSEDSVDKSLLSTVKLLMSALVRDLAY